MNHLNPFVPARESRPRILALQLSLVAVALLSACGSGAEDTAFPSQITGNVQNYTGPSADVGLVAWGAAGDTDGFAEGSIAADGSLRLVLEDPPADALQPVDAGTGIESSNPDARITNAVEVVVMSGGEQIGTLVLASREGLTSAFAAESEVGDAIGLLMYASEATTISGEATSTGGDRSIADATLQAGWNLVIQELVASDGEAVTIRIGVGSLRDLDWYYQADPVF